MNHESSVLGKNCRADVSRTVLWLSVYNFIYKGSVNLLWLSSLTIFLNNSGVQLLPWMYMVSNIILIIISFSLSQERLKNMGYPFLSYLYIPMIVTCFSVGFMIDSCSRFVLLFILIALTQADELSGLSFANMISKLLTIQQAKKWNAVIYGSGSMGLFISGFFLKFLLEFLSIKELLWSCAGLILISDQALKKISYAGQVILTSRTETDDKTTEGLSVSKCLRHPMVKLLMITLALRMCSKFPVDYLYSVNISNHFRSATDLASFLGVFSASIDLVSILLQMFAVSWAIKKFSIGRMLALLPAILVIFSALCIVFPNIYTVICLHFLLLVISRSLNNPANYMMLGAIAEEERSYYFRAIFATKTFSTLFISLVLILIKGTLPLNALFVLVLLINIVNLIYSAGLDQAYYRTLKNTLGGEDRHSRHEGLSALKLTDSKIRLREYSVLLEDPDREIRLETIRAIASERKEQIISLLKPMLEKEKDPACLAETVKILLEVCGHEFMDHIESLLRTEGSDRLKADILESLGKLSWNERTQNLIEEFLTHPNHRVRGCSSMSLLRMARDRRTIETSFAELGRMARSQNPIDRSTAGAVMGELELPLFIPALRHLSEDCNEMTAANALTALSKIPTSASLGIIEKVAFNTTSKLREFAHGLYEKVSLLNAERMARLLGNLTVNERFEMRDTFRKSSSVTSLKLIGKILSIEDRDLRTEWIELFKKTDHSVHEFMNGCVDLGENYTVSINCSALLEKLEKLEMKNIADYAPAIRVMALYDSDSMQDTLVLLLRRYWIGCVLDEIRNAGDLEAAPGIQRTDGPVMLEKLISIIAVSSPEPADVASALQKSSDSDPFIRAVAYEYLEKLLKPELCNLLFPLLYLDTGRDYFQKKSLELGILRKEQMVIEVLSHMLETRSE